MHSESDLLVTKLTVPSQHAKTVSRPRLRRLLDAGMQCKLTIVSAPAGYGKTALLQDWASAAVAEGWLVAWVSLDAQDNDQLRFWSYVLGSLRRAYPDFEYDLSHMLQVQQSNREHAQLDPLLNAISQIPYPTCLVLDDYHVIGNASIHGGVAYCIEYAPANLHIVLSSRLMPPIPHAGLRLEQQLVKISARDLSFTSSEAQAFFASVMDMSIGSDAVASLLDITEGWIVGLKLAALSRPNKRNLDTSAIPSFSGEYHCIRQYLAEEVLVHLDDNTREFLLRTSVLNEFSASLCDAVLGRTDSQEVLNQIEDLGLFIKPLEGRQAWYRFQALFGDALRVILREEHPESILDLNHRACVWLWQNGYPEDAVPHAIAAEDLELAAGIIETCAVGALIKFNLVKMTHWTNQFPEGLIQRHPRLGVFQAIANYFLGYLDLIEPELRLVEDVLRHARGNGVSSEVEEQTLDEVTAIRAALACVQEGLAMDISLVEEVIQKLPETDDFYFGFLQHYSAYTCESAWDFEAAIDAFERGTRFALRQGYAREHIHSQCEIARIRQKQGRLREAGAIYERTREFIAHSGLDEEWLVYPEAGLAELAMEWNDVKAAVPRFQTIMNYVSHADIDALPWVNAVTLYTHIANCLLANGEASAVGVLDKFQSGFARHGNFSAYPVGEAIDARVRLWLAIGDLASANEYLREASRRMDEHARPSAAEQLAVARIHLANGNAGNALRILGELEDKARLADVNGLLIQVLCLEAVALRAAGASDELGHEALHEALTLGREHGYLRVFAAQGKELEVVFEEMAMVDDGAGQDPAQQEYLSTVRSVLTSRSHSLVVVKATASEDPAFPASTLSNREMQIARLWSRGLSAKEIGGALKISLSTTKAHLKNVYKKLGVHERRDFMQKTRELGIS